MNSDYTKVISESSQIILVLFKNWDCTSGVLSFFERSKEGRNWHTTPVVLCNAVGGLRGLAHTSTLEQWLSRTVVPGKIEGDKKTPSGVFSLENVFGFAHKQDARVKQIQMPYTMIVESLECIDDSQSNSYNKIVDVHKTKKDWMSSEKMVSYKDLYQWGVTINYNCKCLSELGSCIFLHCWKDSLSPTNGCIAVDPENLLKIIKKLDLKLQPTILVLELETFALLNVDLNLPLSSAMFTAQ